MSRKKTPQSKKDEAYKHERRAEARSSSKADRRNRPRAKARARRTERRASRQIVAVPPGAVDVDQADAMGADTKAASVTARCTPPPFSPTSVPLREWLRERKRQRIDRTGSGFFRAQAFDPSQHPKSFGAFLRNMLEGGTADSPQLARMFYEMLYLPDEMSRASGQREFQWWSTRSQWLRVFLRDSPEWREPLARWIEGQLAMAPGVLGPSDPALPPTPQGRRG